MEYHNQISGYVQQMRHLGYSQGAIGEIVAHYSGYTDWATLSFHQKRRLADDLKRHVHIARKWHYDVMGHLQ